MRNALYFGDNLDWLPKLTAESVDLIYLDPPFNSQASYNLLYKTPDGTAAPSQYQAFVDSWEWKEEANVAFARVMSSGSPAAEILAALRNYMRESDMMAYLTMMTVRLIEMHRLLKPTGSLFLHCDPTASHFLKIILDTIFGPEEFKNEIIWQRTTPKGHAFTRFPSTHDTLLFYGKTTKTKWHPQFLPLRDEYVKSHYTNVEPGTGRRYMLDNCLNPNPDRPNLTYEWKGIKRVWRWEKSKMEALDDEGRLVYTKSGMPRYKRYLDESKGTPVTSIWADIPPVNSQAEERIGYPTQKPLALLRRVIETTTDRGDLVLDPFCGCGTAIEAAQELGRKWIGIDVTVLAIDVVERRLLRRFRTLRRDMDYEVHGIPRDLTDAKALFDADSHDFEIWALTLVDATPRKPGGRRGADAGVDGVIHYQDTKKAIGRAIVSVKGGANVGPSMIRDLIGTVEAEKANMGVFITLTPPTKEMRKAAASAGVIEAGGKTRSRIQIRTIEQLLAKEKPDLPPVYDVLSAAIAAKSAGRRQEKVPTPEEVRRSPSFRFSIPGGKRKRQQETLPLGDDIMIPPATKRTKKRRA